MTERRTSERIKLIPAKIWVSSELFSIYNINQNGFCFFCNRENAFEKGDVLSPIKVIFREGEESVSGRVVHVTLAVDRKHEKIWMVGVKFIFPEDYKFKEEYKKLDEEYDIRSEIDKLIRTVDNINDIPEDD
jgi:hypothetical protein